jgi:hypothetical protein
MSDYSFWIGFLWGAVTMSATYQICKMFREKKK